MDADERARMASEIAAEVLASLEARPRGDRLTLDVMLLRDYWEQRPRLWAIERLLELAAAGDVDLAVTRYVRDDIPCSPLRDRLDELPELGITETAGLITFGSFRFGDLDGFGSAEFLAFEAAINASGWRPTRRRDPPGKTDWMHLHAHHIQGRDRFLTWDEPLIQLAALLEPTFHLGVQRPDAYLASRGEVPRVVEP